MYALAQKIDAMGVSVDTGNDWMDLGFILVILLFIALIAKYVKR